MASFAAKGLTGNCGSAAAPVLVLTAPQMGEYRASVRINWDAQNSDSSITPVIQLYDNTYEERFLLDRESLNIFSPAYVLSDATTESSGGTRVFRPIAGHNIGFYANNYSGSDAYDIAFLLELLPDAPGAAALYYLNALEDPVAGDQNTTATFSMTPTGPTFSAGTVVSLTCVPDENSGLSQWSGDVPVGHEHDNPVSITMDSAKTLLAELHQL